MRRVLLALVGSLLALSARADYWIFAGGAFTFSQGTAVPNVIGEASYTDAETVLIGAGFILGTVSTKCSDTAPANEVINQFPASGIFLGAGMGVDVTVSSGAVCPNGRPGVRLPGLSIGL